MPKLIDPNIKNKLNDRDWLYAKHCEELYSQGDIALELGVHVSSVSKALKAHGIQSPPQQDLREASNKRRYGVPNPGMVNEFRSKALATMTTTYGGHNWSSGNRGARDRTCVERYGDANVAKTEYAKSKQRETNYTKYGRWHKHQQHFSENTFQKLSSKEWLFDQHVTLRKTLSQIAYELGLTDMTTVMNYVHRHGIPVQHLQSSFTEKQIVAFISSLGVVNIHENERELISPKEVDIFLPDFNLAIEYCGLYWHSEENGKDDKYHLTKLEECNKRGVRLITIFEDEWTDKPDIVKTKLANIIKVSPSRRVYARKCTVGEVSSGDKAAFFNQHHIQGTGPGSITYGLRYNDEWVAMVTFINHGNGYYTLNRFATSSAVVGGFSKLLSHFERNHSWSEILSFADRRWSEGNVYAQTGFALAAVLKPDYEYIVGGKRVHKFNYRHSQMRTKLPNYDPSVSELINMKNHSIMKIWNCGLLRYLKSNNQTQG